VFAYIFFPAFVLLGQIVLLTLFIGIVCAEMDSMSMKQEIFTKCSKQVKIFQAKFDVPDKQVW
jgi:hypothetical protein